MEDSRINKEDQQHQSNQDIKVVKYGFWYGVWKVVSFPFIMLYHAVRLSCVQLNRLRVILAESRKIEQRKKDINSSFKINRAQEEKL